MLYSTIIPNNLIITEGHFIMAKEKKSKKKLGCLIIFLVILALIIALIAFLIKAASKTIAMANIIPYGEAAIKDLSEYVNVSGNVSSNDAYDVTAEVLQKVSKLNVKVGDSVKKGDVLCQLDTTALQEQYDKLVSSAGKAQDAQSYKKGILNRNLTEARNNKTNMLNKAQNAIDNAVSARDAAYERYNLAVNQYNELIAQTPETEEEAAQVSEQAEALKEMMDELYQKLPEFDAAIEQARTAYNEASDSADQLIQSAQDAVDAEQYSTGDDSVDDELEDLQEKIDACTILAPADGVVTALNITEGSLPMNNHLMTVENTDSLVIRGKVSEADILRISEDMACEIKTTATDDKIIAGSVARIERILSSGSDASMGGYTVEISIDDPDSKLLIGMSASVKIVLNKVENVLSVPYDAVRGGENDGYFVFTFEPTEEQGMVKVVKKDIEIGFEGDFFTEIKKGDIKEGDTVLTDFFSDTLTIEEGSIIPDPTLMNSLLANAGAE